MMTDNAPLKFLTLIPAYNCANLLGDAVNSILAQTGGENRIVICDDASTDSTAGLAMALSERHPGQIHLLRNSVNLGSGGTRNRALDYVRSQLGQGFLQGFGPEDFLCFLDADDECLPERYLRQAQHLQSHPDCRMVGGWLISFGEGLTDSLLRFPCDADEVRAQSLFETVNMPSTYFCRIGTAFHPSFHFATTPNGEDWEFFIRNQAWLNFENLPRAVCRYRQHPSNATLGMRDSLNSTGTRLRLQYLLDAFGMAPSMDELKLHITISPCKYWKIQDQAYFWAHQHDIEQRCAAWLSKIGSANGIRKFMAPAAWSRVAARIQQGVTDGLVSLRPASYRFDLNQPQATLVS